MSGQINGQLFPHRSGLGQTGAAVSNPAPSSPQPPTPAPTTTTTTTTTTSDSSGITAGVIGTIAAIAVVSWAATKLADTLWNKATSAVHATK